MKLPDIFYILDDHNTPVVCNDVYAWEKFMADKKRIVSQIMIDTNIRVSTVFVGISFLNSPGLQMFETMVFGGERDGETYRCDTWEQAVAQHNRVATTFTADNRWKCDSCGAINIVNENLECRRCGAHPDK